MVEDQAEDPVVKGNKHSNLDKVDPGNTSRVSSDAVPIHTEDGSPQQAESSPMPAVSSNKLAIIHYLIQVY